MCGRVTILIVLLFCFPSIGKTDTHPFSIHDMLAMDRISDPQVSSDGKWIVFAKRTTDLKANRGRTDLWVIKSNGSDLRRLTTHGAADYNARWSADGREIWFLSTRSGTSQVWRINTTGGEAEQFTDLPLNVGNLCLAPDGKSIAYTMEVFVGLSPQETKTELDKLTARKTTGRIYDKIFIRHWDTWKDGRRSHLFVQSISQPEGIDLMPDMDADTPSKPFGGPEEITFTPDSRGVVFTARDSGREEPWSTDFDLYYAPCDGQTDPRCLTPANEAWDTTPAFSPDGKTLAYLAMKRPRYESDRFRLTLMSWPEGKVRALTEAWDFSPASFCWAKDGQTIYVTAPYFGESALFAIDAKTGKVKTLLKDGYLSSPGVAGSRIVFGRDTLKNPLELFSIKVDGKELNAITRINEKKIAATRLGDFEQFSFPGWNNEKVFCYIVKPVDFDPMKKYPVAFLIHGGPQGSFGNHFHYRWNPQAYAGAGYAVVMVDFHGSVGYGQDFTDSIGGDWGGKPLEDLQKGLAAALARYTWMDGTKVGALGASFGGYMINWIAGNWSDRFRCLVNHDGNLDERMAYFATEELWFPEWDHQGTPWTNPRGFEKHNPVNFVGNWNTPMLVIHGAFDFRVVETQGFATFNALQRRGIPSKLLYFPDENHWVLQPHNSILWHDTVLEWLDKYCK